MIRVLPASIFFLSIHSFESEMLAARALRAAAGGSARLVAGLPPRVKIVEVGPRDGLQNEPRVRAPRLLCLWSLYCCRCKRERREERRRRKKKRKRGVGDFVFVQFRFSSCFFLSFFFLCWFCLSARPGVCVFANFAASGQRPSSWCLGVGGCAR